MTDEEFVRSIWQIVTFYQTVGATYNSPRRWAINFGYEQIIVEGEKENCAASAKIFTKNRLEEIRAAKAELLLLDSYRLATTEKLATLVNVEDAFLPHLVIATTKEIVRLTRTINRIYGDIVKMSKGMKNECPSLTSLKFSDII